MSDDQATLYVEDENVVRMLVSMVLEEAGFEVVIAENGSAALEILDDNADPFVPSLPM
jgi:CheY-like chemotaxis protein